MAVSQLIAPIDRIGFRRHFRRGETKVQAAGGDVKVSKEDRIEQTSGLNGKVESHFENLDHSTFVQLHREIAQECLGEAKQNLNKIESQCQNGFELALRSFIRLHNATGSKSN
jgi:hypothetical protein